MKERIEKICSWSDEKGLTEHGIMNKQFLKIKEEIEELRVAIEDENLLEIKDAIGDIFVTLIVAKQMENKDYEKVQRSIYGYYIDRKINNYKKDAYKFLIADFEELSFVRKDSNYVSNKIVNSMIGTLYVVAKSYDMELLDCVDFAYEVIRKRKGAMIDGSFVKNA